MRSKNDTMTLLKHIWKHTSFSNFDGSFDLQFNKFCVAIIIFRSIEYSDLFYKQNLIDIPVWCCDMWCFVFYKSRRDFVFIKS